jgi:hypothetical protein
MSHHQYGPFSSSRLAYILCHIIIHAMSHHQYGPFSSSRLAYILCHIIIHAMSHHQYGPFSSSRLGPQSCTEIPNPKSSNLNTGPQPCSLQPFGEASCVSSPRVLCVGEHTVASLLSRVCHRRVSCVSLLSCLGVSSCVCCVSRDCLFCCLLCV